MSDNYQSLLDCYFDRYTPNGKLAEDSDEDSGIVQNNHDDRYSTTERIHGPSAVKFDTRSVIKIELFLVPRKPSLLVIDILKCWNSMLF